jgi:hypothetical protein
MRHYRPHLRFLVPVLWPAVLLLMLIVKAAGALWWVLHPFETDEQRLARMEWLW